MCVMFNATRIQTTHEKYTKVQVQFFICFYMPPYAFITGVYIVLVYVMLMYNYLLLDLELSLMHTFIAAEWWRRRRTQITRSRVMGGCKS